MKTDHLTPRLRPIPLWGPNYQDPHRRLGKSRGSKKGVAMVKKLRAWKRLADRMRLFPPERL